MKLRYVAAAGMLASVMLASGPVGADIDYTIEGIATGDPGDIILITELPIPAELVGQACDESVTVGNNDSVHPNTDILLESGGSTLVIPDVESGANLVTTAPGTIVLGETLKVELRLGENGVSSGGLVLALDCEPEPAGPETEPEPEPEGPETEPSEPETELPETEPSAPTPGQPDFTG